MVTVQFRHYDRVPLFNSPVTTVLLSLSLCVRVCVLCVCVCVCLKERGSLPKQKSQFHIKRAQLRKFRCLIRILLDAFLKEVSGHVQLVRRPRLDPKHARGTIYRISCPAWERLKISEEELEKVAGDFLAAFHAAPWPGSANTLKLSSMDQHYYSSSKHNSHVTQD